MVSLIALAAVLTCGMIPLPTVGSHRPVGSGIDFNWTLLSLGLNPFLTAFILVELAALLVPAWRPLRVGGPSTRCKLRRAALIFGLILTAGQALTLALGAEYYGMVRGAGWGFRLLTVVTLLGTAAMLILLAQQVDLHGLGNGFSVLLLASMIPEIVEAFQNVWRALQSGLVTFSSLLSGLFIVAGLVAATLWMFSSYRLPIREWAVESAPVRLPVCGIIPLTTVTALLLFHSRLANLNRGSLPRTIEQPPSSLVPPDLAVLLLVSVGLAALFSWLFNKPSRVAEAWQRVTGIAAPGPAWFKPAILESTIFILLVVLGQHYLMQFWGVKAVPPVLFIVIGTGISVDLVREARAHGMHQNLVPVWEVHRLYAVDPAMRLLASEGIQSFPRGVNHRTLLQFLAPSSRFNSW